jgi:hypothetical protein
VPFWRSQHDRRQKNGLIWFDLVGFSRIGFDSQMGSFGKNTLLKITFADLQVWPGRFFKEHLSGV